MKEVIEKLLDKDDKSAYEYAKKISIESAKSDKYLSLIPTFANMLDDKSSFVRTRFFVLICNQARWASDKQIEKAFEKMRPLLYDDKPTVVRQCLNALHEVVLFRPEMSDLVNEAIQEIDLTKYKDSMSQIIKKDIEDLKRMIG